MAIDPERRLSHVSRTAATSSRPCRSHVACRARPAAAGSGPLSASRAESAARDWGKPMPGSSAHKRPYQARAAASKTSGSRASSPRQTVSPSCSDPRRTALGSGGLGGLATSRGAAERGVCAAVAAPSPPCGRRRFRRRTSPRAKPGPSVVPIRGSSVTEPTSPGLAAVKGPTRGLEEIAGPLKELVGRILCSHDPKDCFSCWPAAMGVDAYSSRWRCSFWAPRLASVQSRTKPR